MKDKKAGIFVFLKILFFIVLISIAIIIGFLGGYYYVEKSYSSNKDPIQLENPMKKFIKIANQRDNIVIENNNFFDNNISYREISNNTNNSLIQEGVLDFNKDYIEYVLIGLGADKLHKSSLGYGNPIVKFDVDNEIWNIEVKEEGNKIEKGDITDEDLIVYISKEEVVGALLEEDIKSFMKNSVKFGDTVIEVKAGKVELASKGYLEMYNELSESEGVLSSLKFWKWL